jgi:hypothetical protein
MVEPVRHRRTKGAETDMFEPKATASHLDSTDTVAKLQNAMRSISRKLTKRAAIADRCRLQAVNEVACELIADYVVPQMIIRSPHVRPGKFVLVDAKTLLQQYRRKADVR